MDKMEDELHGIALKFVAEMGNVKEELRKTANSFFNRLIRDMLGRESDDLRRVELNKVIIKVRGLVEELIDLLADKTIVSALKHIQLLVGEIGDARRMDEVAEKIFNEVKDRAEHYRLKQRVAELESTLKKTEELMRSYAIKIKEALAKDEKYRVVIFLEEEGASDYGKISERLGIPRSRVRKYVKELEDAGMIQVERSRSRHVAKIKEVPWSIKEG
nr:winged helix-turn-helix transcriptional regulator [Candidatus Bathyarchaeota archaeon]